MSTFLLFATERYALPILRPLARALRRAGHEPYWFLAGDTGARLSSAEPRLVRVAEVRELRPCAVFSVANWTPHFFPGAKVQVFHGFNVEKRNAAHGHFRIRGLFDLYCTQGPATTGPFRALAEQHGHFAVAETGWPKLDPLFAPDDGSAAAFRSTDGRPMVMYAATFTERLSSAPHLHDEIARLVARGDRYWLLTLHPKSAPNLVARYRALAGPNARFVEAEDLVPAERAADVLVSDTSSVISEFVVQGKPVVTFRNRAPRPHMLDIDAPEALDAALARALAPEADWLAALRREADAIHPSRDGRASERVIAATLDLIGGRLGALAPKPVNPWRKLQMRWKLRWFGASR